MKKLGVIAFLFTLTFGLFAEVKESDLYYVNVPIVRAFMHTRGYYIIYRTPKNSLGEVFVPYEWFKPNDKRARLRNSSGRIVPYLSLYTKAGEFDHINVVIPIENPTDLVWGFLKSPSQYNDKFDIETIEFTY